MEQIPETEERESLDLIDEALEHDDSARVGELVAELHPSEIATILDALPGAKREALWELIGPDLEGEVLSYTEDAVRAGLLEGMAPSAVAAAMQGLDADDAADILQDLPKSVADEVMLSLDEQARQRLATVLSYPEDTAGGLMDLDAVTVRSDVTLDVVLRYLRLRGALPQQTDSLFVVDRHNRYLGVLPLTEVLIRDADTTVAEAMDEDTVSVPADLASDEVAKLFAQRDLVSAPVLDAEGRLIGRITVDDVLDVVHEQGEHTFMGRAGLDEGDDMFAPVLFSARRRAVWLGINLLTAFVAAWVIGRFEATIQQLVALAILMPVVASMGGIAGTQTLTIVIRGLALGKVGSANARSLMYRELGVAALNGLLWAVVVGVIALAWFSDPGLGLVIATALLINLLTAALAGAMIPLALRRLSIDPAIAGGVVLTTVTDVIGFLAFLGIATLFLL